MPFEFQTLLPIGHDDATPYRLLTKDGVSTFKANGKEFLQVDPAVLTNARSSTTKTPPTTTASLRSSC
jgi:hypothetical protein